MTVGRRPVWRTLLAAVAWLLVLLLVAAVCLLWYEMTTSRLQARHFTGLAAEIAYRVEPGPSDAIRFPSHGPFDQRHGYAGLPQWSERLAERGYSIAAQARISPRMAEVVDYGLFAPYREKTQVGLAVADCAGERLFDVRYPERVYPGFESVPPVLVDTLLFIENRELLSNRFPTKNPAVEWDRFLRAAFDQALRRIRPEHEAAGGSTLATQIEKYRHSPEGRTTSGEEKLRQMASASVRAYLDGPDTTAVRRQLVVDYLNTVPLAAARGYGEVIGLGDGMWVWYGREFDDLNRLLSDGSSPPEERALAYKQALSLMISQRRPTGYLAGDPAELERLTNVFLGLLADAGVVSPALRDVARAQPLARRAGGIAAPRISFVNRKAVSAVRGQVAGLLGLGALYELDRLDLAVSTTLDTRLQQAVTERLQSLADPKVAAAAGLTAERLLADSDPAGVLYSFTLFERVEGANVVRVQADTLDQPFDVNEGTRLDLGSTAKLRTLVTYLEIVARLHERLEPLSPQELDAVPVASRDAIGRWAVDYLRGATGEARSLAAMLEAAMERRYSASPAETFFTGGGAMTFGNFDAADDGRSPTVREGMQRSVNLLFIRLMRDIVRHTISELPSSSATLLDDGNDPRRREYLERFADREGREFLVRFHRKYAGRTPEEAQDLLLAGMRPTPRRLAAVFRLLEPEAGVEEFAAFLRASLPDAAVPDSALPRLYADHAIERYDLSDRGYIAGVHPLELWLVAYLRTHPGASLREVVEASGEQRQDVYGWLFKTRRKGAQDARIRSMVEIEAFEEIHRSWQRLGYPFQSLTPSYATALGSSADRPASLAELVGILLNDGLRLPTLRVDALHFAAGTPYETAFVASPPAGERVLPPEVARTALRALAGVVESGTARRLAGAFTDADGRSLVVGGKTGTGDHRFETYGRGGVLLSSRVVSRSGTFVFFLGERHFGTITAYVKGPEAARYRFTSALPTQVLKTLAPLLEPELRREPRVGTSCAADAPVRAMPPSILGEPPRRAPGAGGAAGEALDTAGGTATDLPDVPLPEADLPAD